MRPRKYYNFILFFSFSKQITHLHTFLILYDKSNKIYGWTEDYIAPRAKIKRNKSFFFVKSINYWYLLMNAKNKEEKNRRKCENKINK